MNAQKNHSERLAIPGGPNFEKSEVTGGGDSDAKSEAAAFAAGNLEDISSRNELRRNEALKNHVHRAAIIAVWVIFGLLALMASFLAFHHLAPKEWFWLDEGQLTTLKTIVFSGTITSAASGYLGRRLRP